MPKYRQLHLKILDSIDVNDMPDDFTRLSWVLLSLIVDGDGRGIDNAAWVKSKMYPLREDVTNRQMQVVMDWFTKRGMILRYSVAGRNYFQITNWSKYQTGTDKEARSSIPTPDLLPNNSEPTPDLLRVNAMQCNAMQEQGTRSPSETMQETIERMTGYPAVPKDLPVIDEFVKVGVEECDIREALAFLDGKKTVRGAADLKGSVLTAHGKRVQKSNGAKHTFAETY